MKIAEWNDALSLDFEPMDSVHREFIGLLARAQQAEDDSLAERWSEVIEHTRGHFAREDHWMRQSNFSTANNHLLQHRVVLNVMQEGLAMARAGQFPAVREMAAELASWFAKHTQTLDAALALHMRREPTLASSSPRH
jgi:hemerythrin-like metal-binding protein